MKEFLIFMCTLLLFAGMQQSLAQSRRCSQSTLDRLEKESDQIRDWSKLREFSHRYQKCRIDDAEITEGVSESVARLFADHWDTLPIAAKLFKLDPLFETFALAGINITDSTDDLNRIDAHATNECPVILQSLCQKIRGSILDNK